MRTHKERLREQRGFAQLITLASMVYVDFGVDNSLIVENDIWRVPLLFADELPHDREIENPIFRHPDLVEPERRCKQSVSPGLVCSSGAGYSCIKVYRHYRRVPYARNSVSLPRRGASEELLKLREAALLVFVNPPPVNFDWMLLILRLLDSDIFANHSLGRTCSFVFRLIASRVAYLWLGPISPSVGNCNFGLWQKMFTKGVGGFCGSLK